MALVIILIRVSKEKEKENLHKNEKNTLVIFLSDNGCSAEVVNIPGSGEIGSMTRWISLGPDWANVSNTPFRLYKNYSHECGICTPFIVYWPSKIKNSGSVCHYPGHFIDFMATILDITDSEYPKNYGGEKIVPSAGESFLPLLKGEKIDRETPIFWKWSRGKGVRNGNWKLVSWNGDWELYNMENDKTETKNVVDKYPEIVEELVSLYEKWLKNVTHEEIKK